MEKKRIVDRFLRRAHLFDEANEQDFSGGLHVL